MSNLHSLRIFIAARLKLKTDTKHCNVITLTYTDFLDDIEFKYFIYLKMVAI